MKASYTFKNGQESVVEYINGEIRIDGGKGSGNFGHKGRKGERGGSAKESAWENQKKWANKSEELVGELLESKGRYGWRVNELYDHIYNAGQYGSDLDQVDNWLNDIKSTYGEDTKPLQDAMERLLSASGYKGQSKLTSSDIVHTLENTLYTLSPSAQYEVGKAIDDIKSMRDKDDIRSTLQSLQEKVLFNYEDKNRIIKMIEEL